MKNYLLTLIFALASVTFFGGCAATIDEGGPVDRVYHDQPDEDILDVRVME